MAKYLSYSTALPSGYQEITGPMPGSTMEPCALTELGQPVFKLKTTPFKLKGRLVAYTPDIGRSRRLLAETVLAHYALIHPECVAETVGLVSRAITTYWTTRTRQIKYIAQHQAAVEADKYVHGATSFGRIAKPVGTTLVDKTTNEITLWMGAMNRTPLYLPQTMNIHDHFLRIFKTLGPSDLTDEVAFIQRIPGLKEALAKRNPPSPTETREEKAAREKAERDREETMKKLFPTWRDWGRSPQWQRMTRTEATVRPMAFFDPRFRGRTDRGNVPTSSTPGIMGSSMPGLNIERTLARLGLTLGEMSLETRVRGVDKFAPDFESMGGLFREGLEQNNLNFGAGPSGTTGTLLGSAVTFAGDLTTEGLKEYVLACAAYLVGGGMHTFHEVFTTGSFLGMRYTAGKYYDSLPASFTELTQFRAWQYEFWDVGGH